MQQTLLMTSVQPLWLVGTALLVARMLQQVLVAASAGARQHASLPNLRLSFWAHILTPVMLLSGMLPGHLTMLISRLAPIIPSLDHPFAAGLHLHGGCTMLRSSTRILLHKLFSRTGHLRAPQPLAQCPLLLTTLDNSTPQRS